MKNKIKSKKLILIMIVIIVIILLILAITQNFNLKYNISLITKNKNNKSIEQIENEINTKEKNEENYYLVKSKDGIDVPVPNRI